MTSTHAAAARKAWALLRLGLIPIIVAGVVLVDHKHLQTRVFWPMLTATALWALWVAWREAAGRVVPAIAVLAAVDLIALMALTYESGGAFSQLRKAFILLPLVAALISTPRATARWAMTAVLAYVLVSLPHPEVDGRGGYTAIAAHAIYLTWAGIAAVLLARLARRRELELSQTSESRRRLVGQLLGAEDQARRNLAYALHDESLQSLLAARRDIDHAITGDPVAQTRLREALTAATRQLRSAVQDLHPHTLEHQGLEAAVTQLAQRAADRSAITVHVDLADNRAPDPLTYSLIRELLTNIEKHSHATKAWITAIPADPDHTTITVRDNGIGMPPTQPYHALRSGHIGLASVRERTEATGGTFTLDPRPASGVQITITLPNTPPAEAPHTIGHSITADVALTAP